MTDRTAAVAFLLASVLVVASLPAGAVPGPTDANPTAMQGGANATNASLGASISSFMQASAADAEGEVDDGMFVAAFENRTGEERDRLVRQRAGHLERRLERLRARRAALLNDSDLPPIARQAQAARLTAEIEALRESINGTSEAATRAGVDVSALDELRRNASRLSGEEVSALARGLVGVEAPGPSERGTEDARGGNGTDGGDRSGNAPADGGNGADDSTRDDGSAASGDGAETRD